jgi:hypothetical protein
LAAATSPASVVLAPVRLLGTAPLT